MGSARDNATVENRQFERIPTEVFSDAVAACKILARQVADLIGQRKAQNRHAVLGLATGSTPVPLYRKLIRLHREEGLSFANVVTFNLDEYYGLESRHPESYRRFMHEQLFDHIDISAKHIHLLRGDLERREVFAACREYEREITKAGGIDVQILGIGRTGHIGFNEPGSTKESRTRLVALNAITRRDAARDFLGEANVPPYAITMGVQTILEAREVVLLAWGRAKSEVISRVVESPIEHTLPASNLQLHRNVRFLIDKAAAADLTRCKEPWRVGEVEWSGPLCRQAVVWLSGKVNKPVLKLVDADYNENGMASSLVEQGPAYHLNIRIFNEVQHTITGWPGGKPNADDTFRPERATPFPKKVVVFSPEPQAAVFGMGGTLNRLVNHGHKVSVVYLTSGNLAVPDEQAIRTTDLILQLSGLDVEGQSKTSFAERVREELLNKKPFDKDTANTRRLKGVIRRGEARSACRLLGVAEEDISFLDLNFYEKGRYRQFKISPGDVEGVADLLRSIKPHQIYATGGESDPSSVEGTCFQIVWRALESISGVDWLNDCSVWLYQGTERSLPAHRINMAVPLSPDELALKIKAIFAHQSQRSQSPVASTTMRELWQQAEAVDRAVAKRYDSLGMAEYEAIETFESMKTP